MAEEEQEEDQEERLNRLVAVAVEKARTTKPLGTGPTDPFDPGHVVDGSAGDMSLGAFRQHGPTPGLSSLLLLTLVLLTHSVVLALILLLIILILVCLLMPSQLFSPPFPLLLPLHVLALGKCSCSRSCTCSGLFGLECV